LSVPELPPDWPDRVAFVNAVVRMFCPAFGVPGAPISWIVPL